MWLIVKNTTLKFGHRIVFNQLNINFPAKQWTCILGKSGVGKTSLLRLIANLGYTGSAQTIKKNVSIEATDHLSLCNRVTYMAQDDLLMPWLNVIDNVTLSFRLQGKSARSYEQEALHMLEQVGLYEAAFLKPHQISKGMCQRASLARTLLEKKPIVLMDEPFSNLDINLRKEICNYTLETLKKNDIPVIFVTHDVEEAMSVSDRIIVMKKGKILQIDSPKRLYHRPNNKCVANMLGSTNQFEIKADAEGKLSTPFGSVSCNKCISINKFCQQKKHFCIIRPENIIISKRGVKAKVINKYFLGASWAYQLDLGAKFPILNITNCKRELKKNQYIRVNASKKDIFIFQE